MVSPAEVIVVDDASRDKTPAIVRSFKKEGVILVQHKVNKGKGAAVRTGLTKASGTFIIIQDADLEYNPADYGVLLKPLTDGRADVVFGNRMRTKTPPEFYISLLGNKLLTKVTNVLFNSNLSDVFVGYKAFRRDAIKNARLRCNGFDIEIELTTYFLKHHYRIVEVPISYRGRSWKEGKKITVSDGIRSLFKIIQFKLSN